MKRESLWIEQQMNGLGETRWAVCESRRSLGLPIKVLLGKFKTEAAAQKALDIVKHDRAADDWVPAGRCRR